MRFLTGKRIAFLITSLLVVLALTGWFLFGPGLLKSATPVGDTAPRATIDAGCAAVYQQVMKQGFDGPRIMAEPGFKVEKALYLTGKEAKANYEADANIQDDSHVCYVLVRGNIEVGNPFKGGSVIYSTGFAIYDPQTLLYSQIGSGREIIKK